MVSRNPYQVICIGVQCEAHENCDNICLLKPKFKNFVKGCNYSNNGDCKYCSHKNKCILIRPYSKKLSDIEIKRKRLEDENNKLYEYISNWDDIEEKLDDYGVESVTDVIYFERSKQQMVNRINDNKKLINLYIKKEEELLGV